MGKIFLPLGGGTPAWALESISLDPNPSSGRPNYKICVGQAAGKLVVTFVQVVPVLG